MKNEYGLDEIYLRNHQVKSLRELKLSRGIMNNEALMLVLNKRYKSSDGGRMLFKYLDLSDKEIFDGKNKIISYLNNSEYSEIEELVIPNSLVYVDNELSGYAMPLVENHNNLGLLFNNRKVAFDVKKPYLEKLGYLIEKVHKLESKHNVMFADLNEYNFIVDKDNNLKAIDLDSSYVDGMDIKPFQESYYLLKNKYITSLPDKYPVNNEGIVVPNINSDLYCYAMIILDILANDEMYKKDISSYYEYLFYLRDLGISNNLLDAFKRIYIPKDNINPVKVLDEIDWEIQEESSFKTFEKRRNNNHYY